MLPGSSRQRLGGFVDKPLTKKPMILENDNTKNAQKSLDSKIEGCRWCSSPSSMGDLPCNTHC